MKEKPKQSKLDYIKYGTLAYAIAFIGLPIYIYVPELYARNYGVSLGLLGLALFALRIFDAVQDLYLGYIISKFKHATHKIILLGLGCAILGFVGLYHPQAWFGYISWFMLFMLICTTGYSLLNIIYLATGAVWAVSTFERTKVTGTRESLGLLGLISASVLAAALSPTLLSLLVGGFLLLGVFIFLKWHNSVAFWSFAPTQASAILPKQVMDDWTKRFFAVFALSSFASAIPAGLVVFFIRDVISRPDLTGPFIACYFATAGVTTIFWHKLSQSLPLAKCWAIGMLIACITFIWASFIGKAAVGAYFGVCCASGMALGADLVLPSAMLSLYMEKQAKGGLNHKLFARFTFVTKSCFALGSAVGLIFIEHYGQHIFALGKVQILGMNMIYATIPCLLKLCAGLLLVHFFRPKGWKIV